MTYVPIVPVVTPEAVSRQTQELADLLGRVIQEYEKAHPTVTGPEVSQALQLAKRASSKATGGQQAALLASVVGGLVLMLGLGVFLFTGQGEGVTIPSARLMVAIVAIGLAGVFVAVLKRRE